MFRDFVQRCCSSSFFFFAQFVTRNETAKILISGPALDEKRQTYRPRRKSIRHPRRRPCQVSKTFHGNLGADVRPNPYGLCRHVESWSTVNTIAVYQRNRRLSQLLRARNQIFGARSTFEKTECRSAMELDVLQS